MGMTEILRRIWLFSENKRKSSEFGSKQPTQLIIVAHNCHIYLFHTSYYISISKVNLNEICRWSPAATGIPVWMHEKYRCHLQNSDRKSRKNQRKERKKKIRLISSLEAFNFSWSRIQTANRLNSGRNGNRLHSLLCHLNVTSSINKNFQTV